MSENHDVSFLLGSGAREMMEFVLADEECEAGRLFGSDNHMAAAKHESERAGEPG